VNDAVGKRPTGAHSETSVFEQWVARPNDLERAAARSADPLSSPRVPRGTTSSDGGFERAFRVQPSFLIRTAR
jgi:hypothetical protein